MRNPQEKSLMSWMFPLFLVVWSILFVVFQVYSADTMYITQTAKPAVSYVVNIPADTQPVTKRIVSKISADNVYFIYIAHKPKNGTITTIDTVVKFAPLAPDSNSIYEDRLILDFNTHRLKRE